MIEAIALIVGLVLGGAVVGVIMHFRAKSQVVAAETTAKNLRDQDVIRSSEMERLRETLSAEQRAHVTDETQLAEVRRSLDEQKARLDEAVARLTETFKSLSQDVLRSNSQEFLDRAKESLGKVLADTKGEMGGLVTPLRDALGRYESQVREIESKRVGAYSGLTEQLQGLVRAQKSLEQQTTTLAQALKAPTVRGKWGEVVLDRVLELSGLPAECVEKQVSVDGEEGALRPDVVVRFPGERCIIIDSKAPLDAYLAAAEATDPDVRRDKLAAHAVAVRRHVQALSSKAYWSRFPTAEFVVLFMPAESILSAAVEQAPGLIEEAMENRVILASPTSLVAALHTIAHTWRQYRLAEGARKIADAGVELYDRLCTFVEYLASIRTGLDKATDAYNKAVGSWERRVEPAARRLKELGAAKPDQELPELDGSDGVLRHLPAPEKPAEGGPATS